jgi:hypothetical protein
MNSTITHGSNADCPEVQSGRWSRCEGHEVDDGRRLIEVMPPVGGNDYKVQDRSDALNHARGIEHGAKAIKNDIRGDQIRDAIRHSMQLAQSLVELQAWLMKQPQ